MFLKTQSDNIIQQYLKFLQSIGSFSNLFSSATNPYIQYRVAENIFCKAFDAENLARADVAYDAIIDDFGIGIKTFILTGSSKIEKVAEFNSYSVELRSLSGIDLAKRLAYYRNERINYSDRLYGINNRVYHIIGRSHYKIKIFETSYDLINIDAIKIISQNRSSLKFRDDKNEYSFNFSKSVLMKRFNLPEDCYEIDVSIIPEPIDVIFQMYNSQIDDNKLLNTAANPLSEENALTYSETEELIPGTDYVILPLYSVSRKKSQTEPIVPIGSQLNQWNAGGRKRDLGEVYIPIPIEIHQLFPAFFPDKDIVFNLKTPDRKVLTAKICSDNNKALMTNPNNALADWMLRRVLSVNPGEILTYGRLVVVGFDSVKITKIDETEFLIDFTEIDEYEHFIENNLDN